MFSIMLCARILGPAQFGELGLIQSSISLFEAVTALGMGVTASRYIAEYRKSNPTHIGKIVKLTYATTLISGSIFAVLLIITSPWLAEHALGIPHLSRLLQTSAVILLLNTLSGGYNGILVGFEAFRSMASINTLTGLINLPLVIGGAIYLGVYGAVIGLAASAAVNALFSKVLVTKTLKLEQITDNHTITKNEWKILWHFSLPAMLAGLMIAPVNWASGVLLVTHAGAASMGLYSAANQWFSLLLFLPSVFTNTYLPIFASNACKGKMELVKIIRSGIKAAIYSSLPFAVMTILASPFIMKLYGGDYAQSYPLLMVIAATSAVAATQNMLGNALAVINRMWMHFTSNLLWAIVYLLMAYNLLSREYGAMALCLAGLLAYFFKLAFSFLFVAYTFRRK